MTRVPKPSATWENVIEPRPHMSDRQAAKVPKFRPDRYADGTEIVVWLDGSVQLHRGDAISQFIKPLFEGYDIAAPPHTLWNTIERESRNAQLQGRHQGQRLEEQYLHYEKDLDGTDPSVWLTAVMARRVTPETCNFGDQVLLELLRWTVHDQLAVPYVVTKLGVNMGQVDLGGTWYPHWPNQGRPSPFATLRILNRPEDGE